MTDNQDKTQQEEKRSVGQNIAIWGGFGVSMGTALGAVVSAVTGNVGFWLPLCISIGMGFGMTVGALLSLEGEETT